jgi:TRAP-type mannitol/chloroaromatic compound transport system permease small subunit
MKNLLQGFIHFVNIINENIGRAAAWLTTVLVLLVCGRVLGRIIFNSEPVWMPELEWHLFSLIFLLGAGYTLKHDKHVRVDLFYADFSEKDKALVNLIGSLVFLIPWCLLMMWVSFDYAMGSYKTLEGSPNPNGLPYRFIIKFAITIGAGLLLLQALALVADSILKLGISKEEVLNKNQ